jgi:hypothetical protein
MSGEMTFSADIIVMNQPEAVSEESSNRLDDSVMNELKMLQALTANGSNAPATSKQGSGRSPSRQRPATNEDPQPDVGRDVEQSTYERIAEERRKRIADWLEKSGANDPIHAEDPGPSHRRTDKAQRRHSETASMVSKTMVTQSVVTQSPGGNTAFSTRKRIARRLSDPMLTFLGSFSASKNPGVSKMLSFFSKEKPVAPYVCGELTGLLPHLEDLLIQILPGASPTNPECEMQPEDFTACKKVGSFLFGCQARKKERRQDGKRETQTHRRTDRYARNGTKKNETA